MKILDGRIISYMSMYCNKRNLRRHPYTTIIHIIEHKYLIWDRAMDMIPAKGRYPVKRDVLIYSENGAL